MLAIEPFEGFALVFFAPLNTIAHVPVTLSVISMVGCLTKHATILSKVV